MLKKPSHIDELRGVGRLAVEATCAVTDVVEAMHRNIASGPAILGKPLQGPARLLTGVVYRWIRGVTRRVGSGVDLALSQVEPLLGKGSEPSSLERDALLAALNGVLGDYLHATGNPLAVPMRLRQGGRPLDLDPTALQKAFPKAGGKLLVLAHGCCLNDRQWDRLGHDHGASLARDLGYTPLYLHYNSGLHISTNGRALSALLERLVAHWPAPVDELVLLAHSMGGLVSRSACAYGESEGHRWRQKLRALVSLGTPHHGAPLERGGNWVDLLLTLSRYSSPLARLGQIRSAGVTDMRFGNTLDEHWHGRDRFALAADPRAAVRLPEGVACFAIAATRTPSDVATLTSDGLVPVDSALGRHGNPGLALQFPETNQWIGHGMGHLDLLSRPAVYTTLHRWLSAVMPPPN